MLYKEDWDKAKERLEALWEREVIDRCCVAAWAPREGCVCPAEDPPESEADLFKYYLDGEWLLERHLKQFANTFYGGESFPCIWPNFGTAGHAKYMKGSKYHFAKDTIWYEAVIGDYGKNPLEYDPQGILALEQKTLAYLAAQGMGKFFVAMPDNAGILDALAHLRGTDNLLFDLIDEPEGVKNACRIIMAAFRQSCNELYDILKPNNEGGSTHGWMYTWSQGRHAHLQVDFSVMISPEMYEEFALPELAELTEWFDYSTYHLDGREQVRHLEMILSLKGLNMIQWTPVAGQPPTSDFLPVLQKIQKAGKGLVLFPRIWEIEKLMSGLSSRGLYLIVKDIASEAEAREIVKNVSRWTK